MITIYVDASPIKIPIHVEKTDTIQMLIKKMHDALGFPPDDNYYLYNSRLLSSDMQETVEEFGISECGKISVLVRLHGRLSGCKGCKYHKPPKECEFIESLGFHSFWDLKINVLLG